MCKLLEGYQNRASQLYIGLRSERVDGCLSCLSPCCHGDLFRAIPRLSPDDCETGTRPASTTQLTRFLGFNLLRRAIVLIVLVCKTRRDSEPGTFNTNKAGHHVVLFLMRLTTAKPSSINVKPHSDQENPQISFSRSILPL